MNRINPTHREGGAPHCDVCGSITVHSDGAYRCMNCGNSMGCPQGLEGFPCSQVLAEQGKASPKHCARCGQGPCRERSNPTIDPETLSPVGRRYRLRSTGRMFRYVTTALASDDMKPVVIYRSLDDQGEKPWYMPLRNFCDGRFEVLE